MHIQEIKKMASGKYKIKIDDEVLITYDDVLLKNNILTKKDISDDIYHQLKKDHLYYDAYNKTVNYILKRVRSKKEVEKYLTTFPVTAKEKKDILKHLEEIGLLNDRNYAKAFIADSINLGNSGPYKIRHQLLDEDIDETLIDELLSEIDRDTIYQKAYKLIAKKMKATKKQSAYMQRKKIVLDMINLGYDHDMIDQILDEFTFDETDTLRQEYDKAYTKLSRKYEGYALDDKIRQKLYAKGFDINAINNIVNEKKMN